MLNVRRSSVQVSFVQVSFVQVSFVQVLTLAASAVLTTLALAGCAVGNTASVSPVPQVQAGRTISGRVMGGQQPIGGATINIYQTGNTGYGAGSTLIATTQSTSVATSNGSGAGAGNFNVTIPTVTCPGTTSTYGPAFYATASGGDATGATSANLNPQILLVSLFDTCATSTASYVAINELTTVAAAYAMRGFATDASGTVSIGTPTTNNLGLNDAMANANLLVNAQTGKVKTSTAAVVLPTYMLNTLADVLGYCVNQASGSMAPTNCTNLFTAATPPTGGASVAVPTDTFQAALNMAQYPGNNVATLLGYAGGAGAPYTPTVSSASSMSVINDLTLGIGFVNNALNNAVTSPDGLAIDANDNVFAVGAVSGSAGSETALIGEVTSASAGAAETSTQLPGTVATPQQGAFDLNNNLYLADSSNGVVIELPGESVSGAKVVLLTSPDGVTPSDTGTANSATIGQNTWGIAVDNSNDVFTASYRSAGNCKNLTMSPGANSLCQIEELPSGSSAFAASFSGTTAYTSTTRAMAADANTTTTTYKGNVWATDYGDYNVHILNPTTGANVAIPVGATSTNVQIGIALDASSNAWVTGYTQPTLTKVYASDITGPTTTNVPATAASPAGIATTLSAPATGNGGATVYNYIGGLYHGRYDAIDGAGNVFVANGGNSAIIQYSPSFNANAGAYLSPYYGFSPSLTQTTESIGFVGVTVTGTPTTTLTTANNVVVGQTVVLSGFTTASCLNGQTVTVKTRAAYQFTAATPASCTTAVAAFTPDTGVGTPSVINPALFTCTTAGTTNTCTIMGNFSSTYTVAIDRAGSVWSIAGNATLVELLGLGAPTNPVLAAGQYGVQP